MIQPHLFTECFKTRKASLILILLLRLSLCSYLWFLPSLDLPGRRRETDWPSRRCSSRQPSGWTLGLGRATWASVTARWDSRSWNSVGGHTLNLADFLIVVSQLAINPFKHCFVQTLHGITKISAWRLRDTLEHHFWIIFLGLLISSKSFRWKSS